MLSLVKALPLSFFRQGAPKGANLRAHCGQLIFPLRLPLLAPVSLELGGFLLVFPLSQTLLPLGQQFSRLLQSGKLLFRRRQQG